MSMFSLDPLGRHRLREHDVAELDVPAQHDLARACLPCASAISSIDRVVEHRALRQRAPRLGDDAAVGVLAAQPGLLQVAGAARPG